MGKRKDNLPLNPAKPLKDSQHELFVKNLLAGQSQAEAYINAGYAKKTAKTCASQLLSKASVRARLNHLQEQSTTSAVATRQELLEILTQKARGNLCDYLSAGIDGAGYINYGPESKNPMAVKKIKSRTEFDGKGNQKTESIITQIELADSISAIRTLLEAQGWMEPTPQQQTTDTLARVIEAVAKGECVWTRRKSPKNGLH